MNNAKAGAAVTLDQYLPPLYVRLPEHERGGKRVLRQAGIHQFREPNSAGFRGYAWEYMERSANYSELFKSVLWGTAESFEDCLKQADACGQ